MSSRHTFLGTLRGFCASGFVLAGQSALAANGDHIVTFSRSSVPADFVDRVQTLGGNVTYLHAGAGIALVHGFDEAAATQLAAAGGITDVFADVSINIAECQGQTVSALQDAFAATANALIINAANPATAFFYGLGFQWNMQAIHADTAWSAGKLGSPSVTVAVIDTGIDYRSLDAAGLVDLERSVSFVPTDDALASALFPGVHPSTDLNGHGTHVASQISTNAIAFAGVTSRTRLLSVKVANVRGLAFVGATLMGVIYAADQGAQVANISLDGFIDKSSDKLLARTSSAYQQVFSYAMQKGMVVVAGAANDHADLDHNGPVVGFCDAAHAVCVSATGPLTPSGWLYEPAIYTNYGRSAITVAAPGGNYGGPVSVWPWGPSSPSYLWGLCSRTKVVVDAVGVPVATPCTSGLIATGAFGTSLATPHVTGLAALLAAEYPALGPSQLISKLTKCTVDLGQPGTDPYYGKGHINIAQCVR